MKTKLRWSGNQQAVSEYEQAVAAATLRTQERLSRKVSRKKPRRQKRNQFVGTYREYLASPQWATKRKAAFARYGAKCSTCGATSGLHVHHKTYANLFREPLSDLQILCGGCHANEHEGTVSGVVDPMTSKFIEVSRNF